jgi:PhoH-like ATPase
MDIHGSSELDASQLFGDRKADHLILNAALKMQELHPQRKVILVTKDMNFILKSRALNVFSEDNESRIIKDVEGLYNGILRIKMESSEIIDELH